MKLIKSALQLLILNILIFPSFAQSTLSEHRWKEIERKDKKDKTLSFTDTLFLQTNTADEISIRKGGFLYKGTIDKNKIDFGFAVYELSRKKKEIILKDDNYKHIFNQDLKDLSAIDAEKRATQTKAPDSEVSTIGQSLLSGRWFVYKRENAKPPAGKIDYGKLIKSLDFEEGVNGSAGSVNTSKGEQPRYRIDKIEAPYIYIADDEGVHSLTVKKSDNDELIFEDEQGIRYFLKQE